MRVKSSADFCALWLDGYHVCLACGQNFRTADMVEQHVVDCAASPAHPDGLRCRTPREMEKRDWDRDVHGIWFNETSTGPHE